MPSTPAVRPLSEADIPVSLLHQLLLADFDTGTLIWKERDPSLFGDRVRSDAHSATAWNMRFANKPALTGKTSNGYLHGIILGIPLRTHRVLYAMHHGDWPACDIDHINGIRDDNRISNLRDVSRSINMKNSRIYASNKSGVCGVFLRKSGAYQAYITVNRKLLILGSFSNISDAAAARLEAEKYHGYSDRHGRR